MIGGSLAVLALAAALVLNAMRDSIVFFHHAVDGGRKTCSRRQALPPGGLVAGSLVRATISP
jgi:cytochrome c-type biogenesis protein CcmE